MSIVQARRGLAQAVVAAFALGMFAAADASAASYTIIDLGNFPDGESSQAMALNGSASVVGYVPAGPVLTRAFLWKGGTLRDLNSDLPSGEAETKAVAYGISPAGHVVGHVWTTTDGKTTGSAYLWKDGQTTLLETLSGAHDANSVGQVAASGGGPNHYIQPYRWWNGVITGLGTLGGPGGVALGINEAGEIVGEASTQASSHAFLWRDGVMRDLGTLGGCVSIAWDISDTGFVAGRADRPGYCDAQWHAALWRDGRIYDLGVLLGHFGSQAFAVNSHGQVVGESRAAFGAEQRAFLYSEGRLWDLNDLIPAHPDWFLLTATDIDDAGRIVGTGYHDGVYHAFLATPSTPPSPQPPPPTPPPPPGPPPAPPSPPPPAPPVPPPPPSPPAPPEPAPPSLPARPALAKPCVVPRLRLRTLRQAQRLLASSRCRLGAVRRTRSRLVPRGRVVSQGIRVGRRLTAGSRVSITLSLGRERRSQLSPRARS
jgi:probable HAF family extracellular repeat protein